MIMLGPVLEGARVLVTAQRRADDLAAALIRRGAQVDIASTLGVEPDIDEAGLLERTRSLLFAPPDVVVVTTAIGLRGWLETADTAGLGAALAELLGSCRVIARGPKALGALQSIGVTPDWVAESETSREILDLLRAEGVTGQRIAIQLHGAGDDGLASELAQAGAAVVELTVYRWGPPPDPAAVRRSVENARAGVYDAVSFTSAPGAAAWVAEVNAQDALDDVRRRVDRGLLLAAVGPVTAGPLVAAGLPVEIPDRGRMGALVRLLITRLGVDCPSVVTAAGELRVRAGSATLDHARCDLSAGGLAVLRELASSPGNVVSRERLLAVLPGGSQDPHAAEVAVARLRTALGHSDVVKTVYRRGYRLVGHFAADAAADPATAAPEPPPMSAS
jgi:uroporphyrinogen-III synthase